MKKIQRIMLAMLTAALASSCSSTLYTSSGSAYDDLYAAHDRTAIANRQKAEAEARKAEAEARRAKYEAEQAEFEAKLAELQAAAKANATRVDSDGVIVVDDDYAALQGSRNNYTNFVADDYESAYARRLRGFNSITYRMPSSYFNLRYGSNYSLAVSYDPAFYNVMVSGDEVWVEPKYITSMFGSWGASNVTFALHSPWYYGWGGFYDPWYYSSWGFPHYSWYDWNWSICYGPSWGFGLSWGWGGYYRPWRPYHYHWGHHHYGPHWGHHHFDGGPFWGGYGGHMNRGGSMYGSRGDGSRVTGGTNYRGHSMVNRGSSHATPYRSPNSGTVYNSRAGKVSTAIEQNKNSVGRGQSRPSRNLDTSNRNSNNSNNSRNNSSYNSNSNTNRGSSFSSGSSYGGGGSSRGGGGYSSGGGGGSRSSGSRGR